MSASGPSAFGVIGNTDYWSAQYGHIDIARDSRMRGLRRDFNDSNWRSSIGEGSRAATVGKFYAQLLVIAGTGAGTGNGFGLVLVGSESTIATDFAGNATGSIGMLSGPGGAGTIRHNGSAVQTGLAAITSGDTMGLALYRESGSLKVQFYKNGATYGTAVTLTAGSYRLTCSNFYVGTEYFLSVDRDDMLAYMPSDAQPWGAAARVSDVGGYSPTASQISNYGSNMTIDAYLRTARDTSGVDATGDSARTGRASYGTGLIYTEFLIEAVPTATEPLVGLCNASYSMDEQYIGKTGTACFGYFGDTGGVFINNVASPTYATYTTGDRIGVILDPDTGKFWLSKNGTLQAGNPEAGTGQAATLTGGPWFPVATPFGANARVRFCTHAREQRYRPSYAMAWDGADILPELYFFDRLLDDTEITFEVHYPFPWGGSRRSGSPLGAVNVVNVDGKYDALLDYTMRDQELVLYEILPDSAVPEYFARVLVDSLDFDGDSRLSIASRGLDALMEVRIEEPTFAIGKSVQVPFTPIYTEALTWDVCHTEYFVPSNVRDQGVVLPIGTTTFHAEPAVAEGIRRSISPNGRQTVTTLEVFRRATQGTVANSGFDTWSGDNPSSWTTTESGPAAIITQNGSSARFVRTSGSATLQISQAVSIASVSGSRIFIRLNITTYVSGDLQVGADGGGQTAVGVNGTGTFVVPLGTGSSLTSVQIALTTAVGDLSLGDVEIWQCTETGTRNALLATMLEDFAGITSAQYELPSVSGAFSAGGYWTDSEATVRQIVDEILPSWTTDYYTAPDGVITFVQLLVPSLQTPTVTLYETDALGPIYVRDDLAPALTNQLLFDLNRYRYQDSELAASVSDANRAQFTSEGSINTTDDMYAFYGFANGAPPYHSCHFSTSVLGLNAFLESSYGLSKFLFIERDYSTISTRNVQPGTCVELNADRFNIAELNAFTTRKRRRIKSPIARLTFWAAA